MQLIFQLPVWAHGTIELLALLTIAVELALKLRWIGWGTILKHKRTMLKVILLLFYIKVIKDKIKYFNLPDLPWKSFD